MQFLASFHTVLTCSFVVLLAYLLSRVFTYLAHSVIHGSNYSRRTQGSSRSRRIESFRTQIEKRAADEDVAVMAPLQEDDEDTDDDGYNIAEDTFQDAEVRIAAHTTKYDIGGSIFDDAIDVEYDVKRDDGKQGSWNNEEEGMKEEGLDVTDTTELENKGNEKGGMREAGAGEDELLDGATGSESVAAGDAQGSSSPQQRLPPTWSDLERMVNMSSKKHSPPPSSVSPVPEY